MACYTPNIHKLKFIRELETSDTETTRNQNLSQYQTAIDDTRTNSSEGTFRGLMKDDKYFKDCTLDRTKFKKRKFRGDKPKFKFFKSPSKPDFDGDSLPKIAQYDHRLRSNGYLSIFKQANPIHDVDPEKASSIVKNLAMTQKARKSPYFAKHFKSVKDLKMTPEELFTLGQISEQDLKEIGDKSQNVTPKNYSPRHSSEKSLSFTTQSKTKSSKDHIGKVMTKLKMSMKINNQKSEMNSKPPQNRINFATILKMMKKDSKVTAQMKQASMVKKIMEAGDKWTATKSSIRAKQIALHECYKEIKRSKPDENENTAFDTIVERTKGLIDQIKSQLYDGCSKKLFLKKSKKTNFVERLYDLRFHRNSNVNTPFHKIKNTIDKYAKKCETNKVMEKSKRLKASKSQLNIKKWNMNTPLNKSSVRSRLKRSVSPSPITNLKLSDPKKQNKLNILINLADKNMFKHKNEMFKDRVYKKIKSDLKNYKNLKKLVKADVTQLPYSSENSKAYIQNMARIDSKFNEKAKRWTKVAKSETNYDDQKTDYYAYHKKHADHQLFGIKNYKNLIAT